MSPSGYIASGVGAGLIGAFLLSAAASNNDLQAAVSAAGGNPSSDAGLTIVGVLLLLAAVGLALVGIIGAGVKSGRRN